MKKKEEKIPQPKFKPTFGGCYNYSKVKKEGLLDEEYVRKLTDHDDGS